MNERIRELVRKAGGHFSTHNLMSNPVQHRESIELWDDKIEKFAELIVKECMTVCADNACLAGGTNTQVGEDLYLAVDLIKEHFGVKE